MDKKFSSQLDTIEIEVKEHTKILASVDKTLALQAQQLENHMQRTALAEENIKMLREDFKPVQKQSEFISRLGKLILSCAAIGASFGGIATAGFYLLRIFGIV